MKNRVVRFLAALAASVMLVTIASCGDRETTGSTAKPDSTAGTGSAAGTESPEATSSPEQIQAGNSSAADPGSQTRNPSAAHNSSAAHRHSYSNATCTQPAKCSCGATTGSALGHKYENGKCVRCGAADPSAAVKWTYKNGGDDYIIKTDGKSQIKIPINLSHLSLPADDPDGYYIIEHTITRNQIQAIGQWIYFFEECSYSNKYIKNPNGNAPGISGSIRGLYRVKENGAQLEKIPETAVTENAEQCCYVLGFDGSSMYFLKNHGYEPGGDVCKADLGKSPANYIDKAVVYNKSILSPISSYIKDGCIYIKNDPEYSPEEDTTVIKIADLK